MTVRLGSAMLLALAALTCLAQDQESTMATRDPALEAVRVDTSPGAVYSDAVRAFQGIPGIERSPGGRLWATWYGGGQTEGPKNFVMLSTSADGDAWTGVTLVVDPPGMVRAFDPCLWLDPAGRLWLFWAQAYGFWDGRAGVWAITTDNPNDADAVWSAPRRLCHGIMMNKPTVLSTGEWLLPAALWDIPVNAHDKRYEHDMGAQSGSNVVCSRDKGATWSTLGQAQIPERKCDEHILVERNDGSLWMLVRTAYGIGESVSTDRGKTWSPGKPSAIGHVPSARFFIRRLASGNLLLVKHAPPDGKTRSHLTAYVSQDDGATWRGGLLIDDRRGVSYPDATQAPDGTIYLIYDYSRHRAKCILMAVFNERDILEPDEPSPRLNILVNQATGHATSR